MKKCSKCKLDKNERRFSFHLYTKDNLNSICIACAEENKIIAIKKSQEKKESPEIKEKICVKCGKNKDRENFYKHSNNSDGLSYSCKECKNKKIKKYRKNNKDKVRKWQKDYKERKKNDPEYKILKNLRNRVWSVIERKHKSAETKKLLGCSTQKFKEYIERQFTDKMSWDNYGDYWHIDHIIPCNLFDLTKKSHQEECFFYTNLRPLEAKKNLSRPKDGSDIVNLGR